MNGWRVCVVYICLVGVAVGVSACGRLLQPEVERDPARIRAGSYEADPRHTTVLFKVDHLGLSKYIGRFNDFSAQLNYDSDSPGDARLDAIIRTGSIDVNDRDFEATLSGSSWLDAETYPEAIFRTTSAETLDSKRTVFHGDLTLRGVTAPVALETTFNGGAFNRLTGRYTLGFSATAVIHRSDFGIDKFIPAVGDAVEIEVHAEFLRR